MAISKSHGKKAPSQNPVDFALLKPSGGASGAASGRVPDKIASPKPRENVFGKKDLK